MIKNYLFYASGLLLILSAVLYSTGWLWATYLYAAASVIVAACFLFHPYKGDNFRLKRLHIQQAIAALLLPVSAYFMYRRMNEWIVCLLVSALLQTYVVFVREYEERKNRRHGNDQQSAK
jgi:hypothetical protein